MKYKAKKPCNFAGKMYLIGEIIPDGVVQNTAETRLVKSGVIEAVADEGVTPPLHATLEATDETEDEPIAENEAVDEEETAEEKNAEEEAVEEAMADEFTVDNLVGLKKSELIELADNYGLDVKQLKTKTKTEIAEAVLEVINNDL